MPTNGGLIGKENLPDQTGRTKVTEITSSGNFDISLLLMLPLHSTRLEY